MPIQRHSEESGETGIDLAPMLDFVLNLLIFFIITTSFVKEAGVEVSRADAETAVHREKGNILIAIRPNGSGRAELTADESMDVLLVRLILQHTRVQASESLATRLIVLG